MEDGEENASPLALGTNNVSIGTDNPHPSNGFQVNEYTMLTDPDGKYNSHFPWPNDKSAYVSGEKVHLRGGADHGYKIGLTVDGASANVGIGTEKPGVALEVNGTIKASALEVDGTIKASGFEGPLTVSRHNLKITDIPPVSEAPPGADLQVLSIDLNTGLLYYAVKVSTKVQVCVD